MCRSFGENAMFWTETPVPPTPFVVRPVRTSIKRTSSVNPAVAMVCPSGAKLARAMDEG